MARRATGTASADDRATDADQKAQERGIARGRRQQRTADDYLHRTHPDTGVPVVFVPGEALPEWVQVTEQPAAP